MTYNMLDLATSTLPAKMALRRRYTTSQVTRKSTSQAKRFATLQAKLFATSRANASPIIYIISYIIYHISYISYIYYIYYIIYIIYIYIYIYIYITYINTAMGQVATQPDHHHPCPLPRSFGAVPPWQPGRRGPPCWSSATPWSWRHQDGEGSWPRSMVNLWLVYG